MTGWQLVVGFIPRWRCLDDGWLLFDCGSGDTHLLDEISVRLVEMLGPVPVAEDALLLQLGDVLAASADDAQFRHFLRLRLDALAQLGVVEQISC